MGKDPAFLFYPGDWLGGTMGMNLEMKGAYMELLILQFNTGGFTEDEAKEVLSVRFAYAWSTLKRKFKLQDGKYINERLAEEIKKRSKFIESRRLSGLSPKKIKAYAKRTHKRGENRNENEDIYGNKNEIPPKFECVKKYCEDRNNGIDPQYFIDKNTATGWTYNKGKTVIIDWQAHIRTWEKYSDKNKKNNRHEFTEADFES